MTSMQHCGLMDHSGSPTAANPWHAEEMRWTDLRHGPATALLAGFALRAAFVLHHPRFVGDTLVYGDLAHNLLAHHIYGLTEDHVRATLIRLPGYPLFLAFCFAVFGTGHYLPVIWIQVVIDLVTCLLLGSLSGQIFGQRAGRLALWLAALCPFTANYAAAALTETLSNFALVLGLWALARCIAALRAGTSGMRWAAVQGVALAGATLLRPDGVLLIGALLPPMLWTGWRRRTARGVAWGSAALSLVIFCLPMALWTARNWRVYHVLQPLAPKYANDPGESTPFGFARWYRTWAISYGSSVTVYWRYDGDPLSLQDLPARAFDSPAQKAETARIYAQYNAVTSSTPEIEAEFDQLARQRIRAHPSRYYVWLPLAKLADMWLRPRTELMKLPVDWWRVRTHPWASSFQIAYAALNLALLAAAAWGWVRWRRLKWAGYGGVAFACAAWVLLRSALLLTLDNSEARYTVECLPVALLLASVLLASRFGEQVSGERP